MHATSAVSAQLLPSTPPSATVCSTMVSSNCTIVAAAATVFVARNLAGSGKKEMSLRFALNSCLVAHYCLFFYFCPQI